MTTWLNVKNNAESALASAITAAATTLTLAAGDGAKFPLTNFNISIDDEILTCSSRSGDVLTVSRAQEGTAAAAHVAGAIVALNVTAAIITQLQDNSREKLSANRTYYVRTDGNDSNTGLVNSAAGAFKTIQKAIDAAAALDCSIYDVTIQLGAGTYVVTSTVDLKSIIGSGSVTIIGDEATPTNVVIDGQAITYLLKALAVPYTTYKLKGFKIYSSTANVTIGILSSKGSYIEFQNLNFGSGIFQQLRAEDGGKITCTGNYTVAGGAGNHVTAVAGIVRIQSATITVTGTPAFSSYVDIQYGSVAIMNNCIYSGSATGKRYTVSMNGVCYVGGAGVNYFPGDVAGTTATGGQYA